MEVEHTCLSGSHSEFTTPSGMCTCPSKEYEIATTGRHPCPGSEKHPRTLHTIDALRALEICREAKLTDDEILAVVSERRPTELLCHHRFWADVYIRLEVFGNLGASSKGSDFLHIWA
jgi:hypothetical protein